MNQNNIRNINNCKIILSKNPQFITITLKDSLYNIYQSSFNFNIFQKHQMFSSKNTINEIIDFILYKIDHNEIKIDKLINKINFIIKTPINNISNFKIMIYKLEKLSKEYIEILFNEINELKKENNNLKDKISNYEKDKEILKYSNLKQIKLIKENDFIETISVFPSGNFITVSHDKSIKIYDMSLNIIQIIENAHNGYIYYVDIKDDNNFVTCSELDFKLWKKEAWI